MASHKFATKNTNRITSILLYAILEWILIFLLLINGLFSYLISKFAAFFGLAKPCVFCARVDHLFEPVDGVGASIRRILCDEHAAEISKLGYCSTHFRIADAGDMCEDCSLSQPVGLSWMKRSEAGEKDLECSCCGVSLESGFISPFFELKPLSWGGMKFGENVEVVSRDRPELGEGDEKVGVGVQVGEGGEFAGSLGVLAEVDDADEFSDYVCCLSEDVSLEFVGRGLQGVYDEERLLPVELIDDATMKLLPAVDFRELDSEFGRTVEEENGGGLNLESTIVEKGSICSVQEDDHSGVAEVAEDNGGITENKLLDSVSRIADENSCRADEMKNVSGVLEDECSIGDNKPLEFAAERTDIDIVDSQEVGELKEVEHVVSIGCVGEESIVSSSSLGSSDVVNALFADNDVEQISAGLCVGEESIESPSSLVSSDVVNAHSADNDVEQITAGLCVGEERIESSSSWESSDAVNADSADNDIEQITVGQEIRLVLDEKEVSAAEAADVTEKSYSVLDDQKLLGDDTASCRFDVSPVEIQNVDPEVEVEALIADEDPGTPDIEDDNLIDVEMTRDVSIGSQICDEEHISLVHSHRPISLLECTEDPQTESNSLVTGWIDQASETEITLVNAQNTSDIFAYTPQINDYEEERSPQTPIYRDGIQGLNKKIFGRRDSSAESLDGSIAGDFEGFDTMEQLKAALNAERKALSALYADLEEERCASAIAANQTMAMITRLQEEKAAMQMEALQYQRMMEEQSEYDQEALQLLNELLMKREKEKQDLEKELEFYRKKNLFHDADRRKEDNKDSELGETPASSAAADSDDLSSEFREGDDATYILDENYQNSLRDTMVTAGTEEDNTMHLMTFDETFLDFEDERLSILGQLRTLEERLIPAEDEDADNSEDLKILTGENGYLPNGNHEYLNDVIHVLEDSPNGRSSDHNANGKLDLVQTRKSFKGKKLLPLFDANNDENEDQIGTNGDLCDVSPQTKDSLAIIEEFENLHDRLQALEADREFLKYCLGSLKKGERGTHLLEEILEHLRELRSAELRARSKSEAVASMSA